MLETKVLHTSSYTRFFLLKKCKKKTKKIINKKKLTLQLE